MARTSKLLATHAIIGNYDGNVGILFWHDNQVDAYRERNNVNEEGGLCNVFEAPGGNLSLENVEAANRVLATKLGSGESSDSLGE